MKPPRLEYPRPTCVREDWVNLNGKWDFEFDDKNVGMAQKWYAGHKFGKSIVVPFPFQSDLSGIGDKSFHDVVWYRRTFDVSESYRGKRIILHFGAVDYLATVWLNGERVTTHRGGYVPFSSDVTELVHQHNNELVVRVEDTQGPQQPRGKQAMELEANGCVYTRCTGIWQTVWIEPISAHHIQEVHCTPDVAQGRVGVTAKVSGRNDLTKLRVNVTGEGSHEAEVEMGVASDDVEFTIGLNKPKKWTPERPHLYDMLLELVEDGDVVDRVLVYFGLRSIETDGRKILLNGKPIQQRLVLDQGYWPDGIYTAPNDEAFQKDIELTKAFGFNGVRLHQKVADPRYLYWADRMGLLVWAEMANCFEFSDTAVANFAHEWPQVIQRDFNHPCIIAWVPFNESWGISDVKQNERQQEFLGEIVAMTRRLDPTRLVVDNSGWEHLDTDIVDMHDYTQDAAVFAGLFKPLKVDDILVASRARAMVNGLNYEGQPVVVSEYGGTALATGKGRDWGYGMVKTPRQLAACYRELTRALLANKSLAGFCYTQLYDIEQEINGLATYDREPKVDPSAIAKINLGKAPASRPGRAGKGRKCKI